MRAPIVVFGLLLLTFPRPGPAQEPVDSTMTTLDEFHQLLDSVNAEPDPVVKDHLINVYLRYLEAQRTAVIGDTMACVLYYGDAKRVAVPGDWNGWKPSADSMQRVPGTKLFYRCRTLDRAARIEYKILVDSVWILDPVNPNTVLGGFGLNSEIRMPGYVPPPEIESRAGVPRGTIDTLSVTSSALGLTHRVMVYRPAVVASSGERFPSMYALDGGQYLQLAHMATILDNLIADEAIVPVVVIFVDPRTDPDIDSTNRRMSEYAMSKPFLTFLSSELRPRLLRTYHLDESPEKTAIMGISLGGLQATYASFLLPGTFGLCAAQSPAYQWDHSAILHLFAPSPRKAIKMYISTGTIHDAEKESRIMRNLLRARGYELKYEESPEGHNWMNWAARIGNILKYFFGAEQQ